MPTINVKGIPKGKWCAVKKEWCRFISYRITYCILYDKGLIFKKEGCTIRKNSACLKACKNEIYYGMLTLRA